MGKVAAVADEDDWKEADGWVGKWIIVGQGRQIVKVYEIRDGRFWPTTPRESYVGVVKMSEDTLLDVLAAAVHGKGAETFAEKYAKRHIEYDGDNWVVDSERFRKVLKRLSALKVVGL